MFRIDPKTGIIKTIRGLDYEKENQYILIIGTVENTSNLLGSTTKVVINVQVLIVAILLWLKNFYYFINTNYIDLFLYTIIQRLIIISYYIFDENKRKKIGKKLREHNEIVHNLNCYNFVRFKVSTWQYWVRLFQR